MAESDKHLSVEECRTLLGDEAAGMDDAAIARLRDRLEAVALAMLPTVRELTRERVEEMKWAAYAFRHGIDRDDLTRDADFDDSDDTEEPPCRVQ